MTTANNIKVQNDINLDEELITALYCRLSVEDIKDENGKKKSKEDESNSISNQKQILLDYCAKQGYLFLLPTMNPLTERQGTLHLQIRMLGVQVPLSAF